MTPEPSDEGGDAGYQVRKRTQFPLLCVKCGTKDALLTRRRTLTYVPSALYVAFCCGCVGMILGAVLYLLTRKTMDLTLPTCSSCEAAWERAARRPILFLVGSLLATVVASGLVSMGGYSLWLPLGVGVVATTVGPIALDAMGRKDRVWAKQMDETKVTLVGIHPAVTSELSG
jgi:hypothetical protein